MLEKERNYIVRNGYVGKAVTNGVTVIALAHVEDIVIAIPYGKFCSILIGKSHRITAFIVALATSEALAHRFSHKGCNFGNILFICNDGARSVMRIYQFHLGYTTEVKFFAQLDFSARCINLATSNREYKYQNKNNN